MTAISPSRVARTAAAREWPDVQQQYKIADGVFGFSCAGHGGIVAVIGVADLPGEAVQLARTQNSIEFVVFRPGEVMYSAGGGVVTPQSARVYSQDSLREWASKHDFPSFEVWVGEEDCEWARIIGANDALRVAAIKAGYLSETCSRQYVLENVDRWSPEWSGPLRALADEDVPEPAHQEVV